AEHDVAAGIAVTDGRYAARLAAENVEHADSILTGRNLCERADADEVFEGADALLEHDGLLRNQDRCQRCAKFAPAVATPPSPWPARRCQAAWRAPRVRLLSSTCRPHARN